MKLLLVTDHRFLQYEGKIFDTYCFGKSFFDDYLKVFRVVHVCSRIAGISSLPLGAFRSDAQEIKFIQIPDITGLQWILRSRSLSRSLLSSAIDSADAVVVRIPSQLGYWTAKLAYHKGKPYMIEVIGDPEEAIMYVGGGLHYRVLAWLEMNRMRVLAKNATVASYVSNYLQAKYPVKSESPNDIISSIRLYDTEISSSRKYKSGLKPFRVVFVASLLPYKRQSDLIHAAAICRSGGIPLQLHFAGDGRLRLHLELLVSELNMKEHVIFHGHIADRQQLVNLLDASDIFVITSGSEGLPRSVLEAMSRGLPVIGSCAGGIPELVRDSELFTVGDVEQLAKMLTYSYKNPDYLELLSSYSIETASKYSMTTLSPKRQCLYRKLLESAADVSKVP